MPPRRDGAPLSARAPAQPPPAARRARGAGALSRALRLRSPRGGFLVLDGGLSTRLEALGVRCDGDALWSAGALLRAPRAVARAHADFYRAGADVATAASYQASRRGFARVAGLDAEAADGALRSAVELAREAAEGAAAAQAAPHARPAGGERQPPPTPSERLVAASLGPYGAVLADGSEYTGAYELLRDELRRFHAERIRALQAARPPPDVYAIETQPNVDEVLLVLEALRDEAPAASAWVSFSCRDAARVCDGTPIGEAAARVAEASAQVEAVGVNCVAPADVAPLLEACAAAVPEGMPLVAYPNSGSTWDACARCWVEGTDIADKALAARAREWFRAGARLIGGCCRTTPDTVAAIAAALAEETEAPSSEERGAGAC